MTDPQADTIAAGLKNIAEAIRSHGYAVDRLGTSVWEIKNSVGRTMPLPVDTGVRFPCPFCHKPTGRFHDHKQHYVCDECGRFWDKWTQYVTIKVPGNHPKNCNHCRQNKDRGSKQFECQLSYGSPECLDAAKQPEEV